MVTVEHGSRFSKAFDRSKEDWENLTVEHTALDKEEYDRNVQISKKLGHDKNFTEEDYIKWATRTYRKLKPEVLAWLEANVKDRRDSEQPKGWCVGNDDYHMRCRYEDSINIFFERRSDALGFIKKFSVYKKPTTYFDYFKEIRKELNLETNTLQKVEDFS